MPGQGIVRTNWRNREDVFAVDINVLSRHTLDARSTADVAQTSANTAQSTADTAEANAVAAQISADVAEVDAVAAQTSANNAQINAIAAQALADTKYFKPNTGIPEGDFDGQVKSALILARSALQSLLVIDTNDGGIVIGATVFDNNDGSIIVGSAIDNGDGSVTYIDGIDINDGGILIS